MDFYSMSFAAARTKHHELLQEAARDRLINQHASRCSFVRQTARSLGHIMVRLGLRLLRYGRVNQTVLIRSQQVSSRSFRSN